MAEWHRLVVRSLPSVLVFANVFGMARHSSGNCYASQQSKPVDVHAHQHAQHAGQQQAIGWVVAQYLRQLKSAAINAPVSCAVGADTLRLHCP